MAWFTQFSSVPNLPLAAQASPGIALDQTAPAIAVYDSYAEAWFPVHCVPDLCRALGLEREQTLSADDIVRTVLATGRAMEFVGHEQLMVKRSLVNGSQRIELTGSSVARLDRYKAQGCFTEIIRHQTRLRSNVQRA